MGSRQRQRGAFLVLAAILMAVLLGMAALGIDVGRVYALRSEMQNAVDAATLAAAAELDSGADARARGRSAARALLQHDSRFATVTGLLGDAALPDSAFHFYCHIHAKYDPPTPVSPAYCSASPDSDGRHPASNDAEAHYVRVDLDPALAAGRFRLSLIFLPVLSALGVQTPSVVQEQARAIGGRNFYTCNVPPIAICDPFEGTGTTFRAAMRPGDGVKLTAGGSGSWTPGNFGFLTPPNGDTGAPAASRLLANENNAGCNTPFITTEPGVMSGPTIRGINTRFDQYSATFNHSWNENPPAPNVVDYPRDTTFRSDTRFGYGDWDFNSYWSGAHPGLMAPNGWSSLNRPSRWAVYNWELDNGRVPSVAPTYAGVPTASHVNAGSVRERRLISVAVVSCQAMDLGGRSSGAIRDPDGYARFFLFRRADDSPNQAIWGEYEGWEDAGSNRYHVEVQLYD